MESVRVRGDTPATLWQLRREDFYNIIDRLAADAEDSKDECEIVDLEAEPPSIFVVSDGSGYSAGGAVSLALKQFEYRYTGTCQGVDVTNFPYIRYKGEIAEVARRARHEDALIVYTLMREEPRNAMIEEVQRAKESDKPLLGLQIISQFVEFHAQFKVSLKASRDGSIRLRAVDLYEPLLMSMEDLLGIPRKSEAGIWRLQVSTCRGPRFAGTRYFAIAAFRRMHQHGGGTHSPSLAGFKGACFRPLSLLGSWMMEGIQSFGHKPQPGPHA